MKKHLLFLLVCLFLTTYTHAQITVTPEFGSKLVGHWEFKSEADPYAATVGFPLIPAGTLDWVEVDGVGTVRVDYSGTSNATNYFSYDINETNGFKVDDDEELKYKQFAMMFDLKMDAAKGSGNNLTSLYRPVGTSNDGRCFIKFDNGNIGVGGSAYSSSGFVKRGDWNRIILNIDKGADTYHIYVIRPDGMVLQKYAGASRSNVELTLNNVIQFFGDQGDSENGRFNVSQIALFNDFLTDDEINALMKETVTITKGTGISEIVSPTLDAENKCSSVQSLEISMSLTERYGNPVAVVTNAVASEIVRDGDVYKMTLSNISEGATVELSASLTETIPVDLTVGD
ncbi:hypothetical protein LJB98_04185, partial [Bacteroidales bacterium OttesenSCG-928-M11]|nr:hypothetical protein [Bacteroidales bacterium OttesenSCG-928-M11]